MGQIIQLEPTIPVDTGKGKGYAHFLMDYGQEHFTLFGVFIDKTREFWWFQSRDVKIQGNWTLGRKD